MFTSVVWSIQTDKKEIYLTFDDGPTLEITEWVLDQLEVYNAKATFFCIGKNILAHPAIFKKLLEKGHSIGNHTFNHLNGWKVNSKKYHENILKTEAVLKEYKLPNKTKLFRPPYGKITAKKIEKLKKENYKIIMWNVLSADFDLNTTKETCLDNVLQHTKQGAVIVFHDSLKASEKLKYSLPKVLEILSNEGYNFKALN